MAPARGMPHTHLSRRRFLGGIGAAAAIGSAATLGGAAPALARPMDPHRRKRTFSNRAAPNPIEAMVEGGAAPPFDFIHWLLPGPEGATTQILELPAFGLDVDPSTITDFKGFTAYAVIAGKAKDHNGNDYDVELDVRVMKGHYCGVDGEEYHGTFGFF